jgi:hypothetical protein
MEFEDIGADMADIFRDAEAALIIVVMKEFLGDVDDLASKIEDNRTFFGD